MHVQLARVIAVDVRELEHREAHACAGVQEVYTVGHSRTAIDKAGSYVGQD